MLAIFGSASWSGFMTKCVDKLSFLRSQTTTLQRFSPVKGSALPWVCWLRFWPSTGFESDILCYRKFLIEQNREFMRPFFKFLGFPSSGCALCLELVYVEKSARITTHWYWSTIANAYLISLYPPNHTEDKQCCAMSDAARLDLQKIANRLGSFEAAWAKTSTCNSLNVLPVLQYQYRLWSVDWGGVQSVKCEV